MTVSAERFWHCDLCAAQKVLRASLLHTLCFAFDNMDAQLAQQLLKAAKIVEERLDSELAQLEKIDEDDLEVLRSKRMAEMRKAQARKQVCSTSHGSIGGLI